MDDGDEVLEEEGMLVGSGGGGYGFLNGLSLESKIDDI